ncbi:MAG: hypothetical protein QOJ84_2915 [Bradyrhizobium sp.]|jgi:hypothetical protein|nr:hypothetical protein [Bradyrhizobium sp.]
MSGGTGIAIAASPQLLVVLLAHTSALLSPIEPMLEFDRTEGTSSKKVAQKVERVNFATLRAPFPLDYCKILSALFARKVAGMPSRPDAGHG